MMPTVRKNNVAPPKINVKTRSPLLNIRTKSLSK